MYFINIFCVLLHCIDLIKFIVIMGVEGVTIMSF